MDSSLQQKYIRQALELGRGSHRFALRQLIPLFLALVMTAVRFPLVPAAELAPPSSSISVTHSPLQPKSGEQVTVTLQLSTNQAIESVVLQVQTVAPGRYIRKTDAEFESNQMWRDFPMQLQAQSREDRKVNASILTATVSGDLQSHRQLVRYRFLIKPANGGAPARWPATTNPCPNFAWFTYDRVPAWTGSSRPDRTPPRTYSSEFLNTLPIYQLIARVDEITKSQWDPESNRKPFFGTLVYDGKVYDHIQYHNRGQASTYVAGKNKWGFKFNAGQEFTARDFWGRPYKFGWSSFDLNPCASAWAQVNRGMAGLDEAISYRAYQLAGVPSADTHWAQLRVVDRADETSTRSQYEGDLWGLYLVVESKNGTWLKQHGMQPGNIFSAESGPKYFATGMPTNGVDLAKFMGASSRSQPESWWREHLDLTNYYSFHAMNRVVANIDLRQGGNHYLYHRPDEHWVVIPHDLDMMFIPKTHWPGIVEQARCLDVPALALEYKNRAREILDLFCEDATPKGGQIGQLVAEMSRVICPPGHNVNWAQLDEAMWNWNPHSNARGQFYVTPYPDSRMGGGWKRTLSSTDFDGFCKYIVDFCTDSRPTKNYEPNDGDQRGYGFGFLWRESADGSIPSRPTMRYTGPAGHPADKLMFEASSFSSPTAAKFSALQWRIAEIGAGTTTETQKEPWRYEIEGTWTSADLADASSALQAPPAICKTNRIYRARLRYKDSTGRWSHWSAPVPFVVGN